MKKQQGRNKALVFTILVIAAVLLGFIFHLVISGGKSADQDTPDAGIHESTDPADTGKKSVRAALKTFDVYRLDDLDFAFVIAILDIESPEHQTVTLDHFRTDEGIFLNAVESWEKKLEEHSYYLGRRNVMFSLVSDKDRYDAALFIPIKDADKKSITLSSDLAGIEDMVIDLEKNVITDGSSLYAEKKEGEVISDEETYSMVVMDALDITDEMLYMEAADGSRMQYRIPATNRVYAMELSVESLAEDAVVISDAEFIPEGYESGYHALDGSIRSMKETNLIGRSIVTEDRGFLFFEVYGPEYSPVTYRGVLFLYLEGKDEPLHINVNLN